jgi:hypothetical protein
MNELEEKLIMVMDLRTIRNNVAHEYGFNVNELTDSLSDIFKVKDSLISIYATFYNYCKERFEPVRESQVFK